LGSTGVLTQGTPGTANFITANYALVQGFSSGTQIEVDLNNAAQALYGNTSRYNPFSSPNTSVTLTQPLLRGLGRNINLRYMRIASINQKVSRLLFYQQLISTVYGVARLYYDLVSLNENVQVQRETWPLPSGFTKTIGHRWNKARSRRWSSRVPSHWSHPASWA
jgi:outer membrane protein